VSTFTGFTMNDLVFTPNKMIASTNKGIFYSIDGGINWVSSNLGMTNTDSVTFGAAYIVKLQSGRLITSGLNTYYSDNDGQSWTNSSSGSSFASVVQTSSNLIGSDAVNIYISNDNGTTWQPTSNTGISPSDLSQIVNLVYLNNAVYASGYGIGVYKSSDNGNTWQANNNGLTGVFYGNLLQFSNKLYKGLYQQGIYEYNLTNNIWTLSTFAQNNVNAIITGYNNGRYFGGVTLLHDDLMYSDNNGQTWQNTNGIKTMNVRKLSASSNLYTLGDLGGFIYDSTQTQFIRTTPANQNYTANTYAQYGIYDIKIRSNGTIYLATAGGVWKSINNGTSYTQSYNGLPQTGTIPVYRVNDLFISGTFPNDTLFAATDNGIYFSNDDAQTFTLCAGTSGAKMQQFLKYQNVLYCAGTKIFRRGNSNSWSQFTTFVNTGVLGFAATDGYLFVSVANSPLKYAPINGLSNFTNIITGTGNFAYSVAAYDTLVFYFSNNGVFKLNTTLLGNASQSDLVQIADNLPYYNNPGNIRQYKYLDNGFGMAIHYGKLWLGTKGMSTFYRSLNDFGYSLTVGGQDNMRQEQGVVYPNPSNDKITMTNFTIGSNLTIYNSVGQLVLNMTYTNSNIVDLNKLNAGLYTYSITDNKQNVIDNGKFIKE
ncbi:MAG: T9SS type A sorting domain-containing protein, partial [Bacteroidota bacterium]